MRSPKPSVYQSNKITRIDISQIYSVKHKMQPSKFVFQNIPQSGLRLTGGCCPLKCVEQFLESEENFCRI